MSKVEELVNFKLSMATTSHPLKLAQLLLRVAYNIQDFPFKNGIHNWIWVKWVASLSLRVA